MAQTLLSQHAVHILSVGIPAAMVGVGLGWDSLHTRRRACRRILPNQARTLQVAATASVAVAGVHLGVMPQHFAESAMYGAFFAVAAAGQLGSAWLLLAKGTRLVAWVTAAGNAAVIVLWLTTRVIGVPVGPDSGRVEAFGSLDIAATVLEAVIVLACLRCLRSPRGAFHDRLDASHEMPLAKVA